jgi:ribosomal protein S18 acetylase RimI-like enzyme
VTAAAPAEVLAWDTEFFGVRVARVLPGAPATLAAADEWCAAHDVAVAYLSLPLTDTDAIRAAERLGFGFVDVRVELATDVAPPARATRAGVAVRPHRPADTGAIEDIAATAHRDSRFYADGRFPEERCDAMYRTWARRNCDDDAVTVLVADRDDALAGYITYTVQDGGSTAHIELIAVTAAHRGLGVGSALVRAALAAALGEPDVATVTVATQARNLDAIRLYERAGMTTVATSMSLHKWYDPD